LSERLLTETGFRLEMSEVREEGVDDGYGPVDFRWVIARKPEGSSPSNGIGRRSDT